MITAEQYFGNKNHPKEHEVNANRLIALVNLLLHIAKLDGSYEELTDPDTGTQISGAKGGSGDGGYRSEDSKTGSKSSSHREAKGIDVYDPSRKLAQWCVNKKSKLHELGLYCEDFRWTPGWVHFQIRQSKSGHVIYIPYSDFKKHPPLATALDGQAQIPFTVKT